MFLLSLVLVVNVKVPRNIIKPRPVIGKKQPCIVNSWLSLEKLLTVGGLTPGLMSQYRTSVGLYTDNKACVDEEAQRATGAV